MDSEGDLNPEAKLTEFYLACKAGNAEAVKNFLDTCEGDKHRLREMIFRQEGPDYKKDTALHCACAADKTEVVKVLLDAVKEDGDLFNELILLEDTYKETALHYACEHCATDTVKVLLETIRENKALRNRLILKESNYQMTGLHHACSTGATEVVKILLDSVKEDKHILNELLSKEDYRHNSPLHYGIKKDPDISKTLLDAVGSDKGLMEELVLKEDRGRWTALHIASKQGYAGTVRTLLDAVKIYRDILKELLLKKEEDYSTAFEFACNDGNTEVVKTIMDAVKDDSDLLEEVMITGNFHLAAENKHFDTLIAMFSEDYTHSLKVMEELGHGTIHKACDHGHKGALLAILNSAIRHEMNNKKTVNDIYKKTFDGLLRRYISHQDDDGRTVFHIVCSRGDKDLVMPVLEATKHLKPVVFQHISGPPLPDIICLRDKAGQTAIHESCTLAKPDILRALMEMALHDTNDVHENYRGYAYELLCATDNQGKTAFFQVFEDGDYIKLKIILRYATMDDCLGKLLISQTENGQTIFHRAMKHGYNHTKCLDIVISQILGKEMRFAGVLAKKDTLENTPFNYLSTASDEIIAVLMKLDKNGALFHKFLMKEDSNNQTVLHRACIEGDSSTLNAIKSCIKLLTQGRGGHALDKDKFNMNKVLCIVDQNGKTPFHHSCEQGSSKNVKTLIDIARMQDGCFREMVKVKDKSQRTCLFYLEKADNDLLEGLIKEITTHDINLLQKDSENTYIQAQGDKRTLEIPLRRIGEQASNDLLTKEPLTDKDVDSKTFLSYASERQKATAVGFLTPFYDALKREKQLDNNDGRGQVTEVTSSTDYVLFETSDHSGTYKEKANNSLLTALEKSNCLALINHDYTQCYLMKCWRSYGRYFFYVDFFRYLTLVILLTAFVISHREASSFHGHSHGYVSQVNTSTNLTTGAHVSHDPPPSDSSYSHEMVSTLGNTTAFYILIFLISILLLAWEVLQFAAKRTDY